MKQAKPYTEAHTIWIDLTDIVEWRGNYTGIQRTQMQLAEHYYAYFPRGTVRFFRHDHRRYAFVEVDFEVFMADQVARKHTLASGGDKLRPAVETPLTTKQLVKKGLKSTLPIAAVKMLSVTRGTYIRRQDNRVRSRTKVTISMPFAHNDKVMILGGNWGSELFLEALLLAKEQAGFKIYHVLYDLIPLAQPAYAPVGVGDQFSAYMELLFQNAEAVFAISESTKRDAEAFIVLKAIRKPARIQTFRLGDDFKTAQPMQLDRPDIIKGKFILCVGTFEVRKNYSLLYYVIKEAKRRGLDLPTIVIAGKNGWLVHDTLHLFALDPDVAGKIIHLHKADDQQLSWLYQNCMFTVFPSFYEGWGLPVAESVFYGKLCLSSDASSMPEIAGDLIDYFAPTNVEACLNKIVHYSTHPADLKRKEAAIRTGYHAVSWDESFRQVLAATYQKN